MNRSMDEAIADLKRDIERWEAELATAQAAGYPDIVAKIRAWIAEGKDIIAKARR